MNSENLLDIVARLWASTGPAAATALRITVIVTVAWILIGVLQRAIRSFRIRVASRMEDRESAKRAETLGRVFRYLVAVVVTLVAGMLVLGEMGISVAPILGAAGVVGLAVGFGAQSLVKDYFTGFFLLLENQISTGDIVQLTSQHAGLVEEVTLRYVRLRDYDGRVHYVPNGQISSVINLTRSFSFAVLDVGVAYRENVDDVMAVMHEVARELRADKAFAEHILEDLEMAGVDQWGDSAVMIKCRFKVVAMRQWLVKREYLRRLKNAFDARGIEIPYPHLTVYAGQDKQGHAPAVPLQLQRATATRGG
ncbi:MAG: mechanosensitive ion channel family protein [Hydrogenophaga sp.]|uniref:mechanosensitive ion channel family protein n=1 Tax=Hydrogenophaga sp. TaxID=1904254 RepID=UPI002718CABA|nr:mechanosensitive ion channel family protein [Hydrogenophaga sp.]MDO9032804.1 mechanosensitive ion channel family protein [Hydrogenophaga sp.]